MKVFREATCNWFKREETYCGLSRRIKKHVPVSYLSDAMLSKKQSRDHGTVARLHFQSALADTVQVWPIRVNMGRVQLVPEAKRRNALGIIPARVGFTRIGAASIVLSVAVQTDWPLCTSSFHGDTLRRP